MVELSIEDTQELLASANAKWSQRKRDYSRIEKMILDKEVGDELVLTFADKYEARTVRTGLYMKSCFMRWRGIMNFTVQVVDNRVIIRKEKWE